jgi:hypothetical protein
MVRTVMGTATGLRLGLLDTGGRKSTLNAYHLSLLSSFGRYLRCDLGYSTLGVCEK